MLTLNLQPEDEAKLLAQAQTRELTVDEYVTIIVLRHERDLPGSQAKEEYRRLFNIVAAADPSPNLQRALEELRESD